MTKSRFSSCFAHTPLEKRPKLLPYITTMSNDPDLKSIPLKANNRCS